MAISEIFALKIFTVMNNYLYIVLFTSTNKYFVQWFMHSDGPYTCTINLQLTEIFHGMLGAHKEQDRCTTFGWNPIYETSTCS